MTTEKKFACAVNCMDGRIQDAVKSYMKEHYNVEYVDMVTEAGVNKVLAENTDTAMIENIKKRVGVSTHHHGTTAVAVVGHFGCAGNPVEKAEHIKHLHEAKKTIESFGLDVQVVPLWVDGDWKTVEKV